MKKFIFILLLPLTLFAQNLNGRFSSSAYTFERYDTNEDSKSYIRTYQSLYLNLNKSDYSFRTRMNFAADVSESMINDPRYRVYNLYFTARNIFNVATLKLGRQPVYNSVGSGSFDGAFLKIGKSGYYFKAYYGGNVPAYQKLEITDDFANDYVLGGKFEISAFKDFHIALDYVDKNFKPYEYEALRLDENLNPVSVLIRNNSNKFKFASAKVSYFKEDELYLRTKAEYDINYEELSKFEFSARVEQIENLGIDFYYNYREPKIRYNSIFSVFNFGNTQEIEGGVDYSFTTTLSAFAKYGYVKYEDDNSSRLNLGVNTCVGSLSYRKTFGYAGELDALSLSTSKSFLDGMLTPSVALSFIQYKLSEDDDSNDLVTLLAGVNYKPFRKFTIDFQTQYLNNKIYSNDVRFLIKLNHWFNSNLDIL